MPSFLTNPVVGGALGSLGTDLLGGLEGIGGFLGSAVDTFGGIFETLQPAIETGLGIAGAVGAFPSGPAGTSQPSPSRPATNPGTMLALGNPADPTRNPADNLFAQVGQPNVTRGGSMSFPVVPNQSCRSRYPSMFQTIVQTPSGGQRVLTYKNMGAPILYSGDLAAKKRVNRVRSRLGKR